MILCNAFSLGMLEMANVTFSTLMLRVRQLDLEEVKLMKGRFESAVGHADTAKVLSGILGEEIPVNRSTTKLRHEGILVAQYIGPRLPEGATSLPEGAHIDWFHVSADQTWTQAVAESCGGVIHPKSRGELNKIFKDTGYEPHLEISFATRPGGKCLCGKEGEVHSVMQTVHKPFYVRVEYELCPECYDRR